MLLCLPPPRAKSDPRSLPNSRFCLKSEAAFRTGALWHPASPQVEGPFMRPRKYGDPNSKQKREFESERPLKSAR